MVLQPYAPMKWESLAGWLILYFPGFARNFDFFFSGCQAFGGFFCCHVHTTKCTLSRCCFRNQQTTRTQYVATALPLFVGQNDMVFWRDLWRKPSFRVKRIESLFFFNVGWFGEIFVILQTFAYHQHTCEFLYIRSTFICQLQFECQWLFDLFRCRLGWWYAILMILAGNSFGSISMVTVVFCLHRLAVWFACWIWLPDELKASTGEWVWISAKEMSRYCW